MTEADPAVLDRRSHPRLRTSYAWTVAMATAVIVIGYVSADPPAPIVLFNLPALIASVSVFGLRADLGVWIYPAVVLVNAGVWTPFVHTARYLAWRVRRR